MLIKKRFAFTGFKQSYKNVIINRIQEKKKLEGVEVGRPIIDALFCLPADGPVTEGYKATYKQLRTLLAQQRWELLRPFARG